MITGKTFKFPKIERWIRQDRRLAGFWFSLFFPDIQYPIAHGIKDWGYCNPFVFEVTITRKELPVNDSGTALRQWNDSCIFYMSRPGLL
jgi:hypothetical protein